MEWPQHSVIQSLEPHSTPVDIFFFTYVFFLYLERLHKIIECDWVFNGFDFFSLYSLRDLGNLWSNRSCIMMTPVTARLYSALNRSFVSLSCLPMKGNQLYVSERRTIQPRSPICESWSFLTPSRSHTTSASKFVDKSSDLLRVWFSG